MLFLCRPPPELVRPILHDDVTPIWVHEQRQPLVQKTWAGKNRPEWMLPIETTPDHMIPHFGPHLHNPMSQWFAGLTEAILRPHCHLNPNHNNSLNLFHSRLHGSHMHYDAPEDPPNGGECIHYLGTRSPRVRPWMFLQIRQQESRLSSYHPSCTYIQSYNQCVILYHVLLNRS
jgi:hypothetical protein